MTISNEKRNARRRTLGIVTAVITTRAILDMGLVPGSDVVAPVKATKVSIAKI